MTTFVGQRVPASTMHVRKEPIRVPLVAQAVWGLLRLLWRALLAVAGSPVAMVTLAVLVGSWGLWELSGPLLVVVVYLLAAAALVVFRWRWRTRYGQLVLYALSRWRRFSIYRYKWPATMDFAGLNKYRADGTQYAPVLLSVQSNRNVDRVRARMLAAQTVDDWGKVSDRLCQTFGAQDCRVRSVPGRPHEVEAWFVVNDPLAQVVEPVHELPVDQAALAVGLREDGQVYRLRLLGSHVLLVGETGAGKSSVIWAIVHALAPAIADGTVELWGVDPKAMELAAGEPLFRRMAYASAEDFAELLEDAVLLMRERQAALRGVTRLHQPSQAEPLVVVLVDELAALSYVLERDVRRRIEAALGLLLSQGRAVGISVVGAIQDPRKETLPQRDLYPTRIALRLTETEQVHLVLGREARDRGARCDEIPHSLQGVGFVQVDGEPEPIRVRFAYVTDDHIRTLVGGWKPALALVPDLAPEAEELAA